MEFVYTVKVVKRADEQVAYETPIILGIEEAEKVKARLEDFYNILPPEDIEEAMDRLIRQNPQLSAEQLEVLREKLLGPVAIVLANKVAVSTCEEWERDHYKVTVVKRKKSR